MHVVVVGAGITGVTLAHELRVRGHDVTVIERLSGPGLETSRANAAQRSYGCVYPWASPVLMRKALSTLFSRTGPFKMKWPPDPQTLAFLMRTLWHAGWPGRFHRNRRDMLALADYSRHCFLALEEQLGDSLAFDGDHRGLIELASTDRSLQDLRGDTAQLEALGIAHEVLDEDGVRELEPGMSGRAPLAGGLRLVTDGTGDCRQFSVSLAKACELADVRFRFNTRVASLVRRADRVMGVMLEPELGMPADGRGDREWLPADAVVLCAGAASRHLARSQGIRLPIYPVKGYSMTLPITDMDRAPASTVMDDRYKVVFTRLGDRLRVSGFVELAGLDRRIPASRLEVLFEALRSRYPDAADTDRAEPWTGFRPMTPDGPPILGRGPEGTPDNLYFNTGHGTFGWTLSAASAALVAQLIQGESPAMDLTPYRAGRY